MKSRWQRLRRRKEQPYLEISLTPLIDVTLNLLIIFMVATPMLKQENGIQVELPRSDIQEIDGMTDQNIVIYIDKRGNFFIDGTLTKFENLMAVLQKKAGDKGDKTAFVKADESIPYGKVMNLVERIKHIKGLRYVGLVTEKN